MKTRFVFKRFIQFTVSALSLSLISTTIFAKSFYLPTANESIIGRLQYTSAEGKSTPVVASEYNLGQNALISANPGIYENGTVPGGTLTVPTEFMLPPLPRKGIVINLPEMRMYYYPKNSNVVMTFPIGIGKIGKTIPIRSTYIIGKRVNPTWTPPEDIRQFNREQGIELPHAMGPGPDNPLGPYAIYLSIPTYLIHSTIFPESIGRRASFGCIRMNEDDIKEFFPIVTPGTPVAIINMPTKVGWQDNSLFLESHPPLEEHSNEPHIGLNGVVNSVEQSLPQNQTVMVNWQLVAYLADQPDGIPHEIGRKIQ